MSGFNAKEVKNFDAPRKTSQFIPYGIQELKITDITIKTSSTTSVKLEYKVEGRPITEDKWVGFEGAVGQVGTIKSSFLKPGSAQEEEEFGKLVTIARKLGVDTEALPTYSSIEDAVKGILPLIKGKFLRYKVCAKYYWGTDKEGNAKEKYSLQFARFKFVESLDVTPTEMTFDIKNQYDGDRRDLGAKPETSASAVSTTTTDDLPF